jgi:ABC-type phosphate/phosphonate transport system substrate-binding protein
VRTLEDLRGKTLALGSRDSGHASILPVHFLAEKGLREGADYRALRFDTDLGKHGDTGTSEVDVLKAVMDGRADAGAVGSPFWQGVVDKKLVPAGAVSVVWTSPPFHHCMFTARVGLPREDAEKLARALFAMKWDDPKHRPILEAEGLKEWVPPHLEGYASLRAAAERQGFFERR